MITGDKDSVVPAQLNAARLGVPKSYYLDGVARIRRSSHFRTD